MVERDQTVSTQVCILGGGPHGLAAAVHLRQAEPSCQIVAVDPAGVWLDTWRTQFAGADIATLRSPMVHHPSPDPTGLRDYVFRSRLARSGLPYDVPTAESFLRFCDTLTEEAELDQPVAGRVHSVCRDGDGVVITVGLVDERRGQSMTVRAEHLVVAGNPHRRVIPEWVESIVGVDPQVLAFGADVDLRSISVSGQTVAVVGGGLTAGHLAHGAATRGAEVHLVSRRPLRSSNFDTDPGWLGPKYLRAYAAEADPACRLRLARDARDGGSLPPWMRRRLAGLADDGLLIIHDGAGVRAAHPAPEGGCQLALGNQKTIRPDQVWLATGTQPDIMAVRPLTGLLADVSVIDGYPVVGADLRLGPHPIHVMGRLATLELGPAAGNLWGAQRAAERITEAILDVVFV